MFNVIMEHVIVNIMLFVFCIAFMLDDNTIIDSNNKPNIKDAFICYLLCALGFYGMFGMIWFIIINGGHLQPLL